jgi:ArsR family transcriptional regulator
MRIRRDGILSSRAPNLSVQLAVHIDTHIVKWQSDDVTTANILRAVANRRRLDILHWLKNPTSHFPAQVDGDLVDDGVCGLFIARKLKVGQPTASEHLRILVHAGLIRGTRIKKWTFYKRNEPQIARLKRTVDDV